MIEWWYKDKKHCRWCGKAYQAKKPHYRDGFHSAACKQAHHRAYKKYVTGYRQLSNHAGSGPQRLKSRKKRT